MDPVWQARTTLSNAADASAVTVESSNAYSGTQAVLFSRSIGDKDTYNAPYSPTTYTASASAELVNVSWVMDVSSTSANAPFFGVYAFNGNYELAYGGVDASNGSVDYSSAIDGYVTPSGWAVTLDAWHSFDLQLNFLTQTSTLYVDGNVASSTGFITPNQRSLTDADLASFATTPGQTAAGSALFDNYKVMAGNTSVVGANNLNWSGILGNCTWDVGTSPNFVNGIAPSVFTNGDNVTFDDNNNGYYTVKINSIASPGSTIVSNSNGDYLFTGTGGIAGAGGLTKNGTGMLTLSTTNTYSGITTVNAGTLKLASAGAFPVGGDLTVAAGASVVVANHGSAPIVVMQVADLNNSGLIDLTNNDMIVASPGSLAVVSAQVGSGYANGTWTGTTGITSSAAAADSAHLTAVGVILNDNGTGSPLYGSHGSLGLFDGANPAVDTVLVKYTYYGDTDLSGSVDGTDYSRIDNGFMNQLTGWYNGDFNYDGVVDGSDYTLIDNAYNQQGAPLSQDAGSTALIGGGSAVPEPSSATLAFLACGLLARRRRRLRSDDHSTNTGNVRKMADHSCGAGDLRPN